MATESDLDIRVNQEARRPALEIRVNKQATSDWCHLCGEPTDPGCGPELFLAGTCRAVCHQCGQNIDPTLMDRLRREQAKVVADNRAKALKKKLEHYDRLGLHPFTQYDGFCNNNGGCEGGPDKDGDAVFSGKTWDAMSGGPTVRLLIPIGASYADVVRVLGKLSAAIKPDDLDAPAPCLVCQDDDDDSRTSREARDEG